MKDAGEHIHKQTRGWMVPYLILLDTTDNPEAEYTGHGRWDYWLDACARHVVPEGPIPQIAFQSQPRHDDAKHIQEVLKPYVQKGLGWYDDAWLDLVKWILHGFGKPDMQDAVDRIPEEIRNVWYTTFNLGKLLRSPCDWSACILQGHLPGMKPGKAKWAKGAAFFSTPMSICSVMTQMTIGMDDPETSKLQTVLDPCVGTGSMLLPASNHSLRLFGVDIVLDLVLCTELNGWLWMPWLVFMPTHMSDLFESLTDRPPVPPTTLSLETRPQKVKAYKQYRAGELAQADFFSALGT